MRRVSLLIDLGGGSVGDHDHVRLLVRRLLSHFSRQRPAPRWCVRFYDSGLSPHAFDAKLRARADERAARRAEEEERERERERNATDSRVHSWVDEHTRETAGVGSLRVASGKDASARLGGASEVARATRYRDFGKCDADATEAFLRHHDEAFALYHDGSSSNARRRPPPKRARTDGGVETVDATVETAEAEQKSANGKRLSDENNRRVDESSWFTTLARQMAATLQESGTGNVGGLETEVDDKSVGLMIVLARAGVSGTISETNNSTGGPNAVAPVALVAAAEEKQRENVARAFKGIEAALRKERTVAHFLRLPFDAEAEAEAEASAKRESSEIVFSGDADDGTAPRDLAVALLAPGRSDVSSASGRLRVDDVTKKAENERRAISVATRSAWRRATALFSGFGGCALPAALVAHAAAHIAPCALMAAAAEATAFALEEREKSGSLRGDSAFSALALALSGDDFSADAGDVEDDDAAEPRARVCVREGALETTGTRPTRLSRRAAASVSRPDRATRTTRLGEAMLVRSDERRRAARDGATTTSSFTVTIESLVALDDEHEPTTSNDDDSFTLVPRAEDDALGGLAALLALRGVAAVAEVTERTRPANPPAEPTTEKVSDAETRSEDELDVMATQEQPSAVAETVVRRRVALVRPLFARALSLRFVDGPREKENDDVRDADRARERGGARVGFESGADAFARALARIATRLGAADWGCVESIAEDAFSDDAVGTRLAAALGDDSGFSKPEDHLAARPFAFASSPEYKPVWSRELVSALPPAIEPGAVNEDVFREEGDRAAGDSVSGGGETRVEDVSLADAFAEAANAAPAGTHRWETWYGDGPGVGAFVLKQMASRAARRATGPPGLPELACLDGAAEKEHTIKKKKNADAALAARFDAMVRGLPAPANPPALGVSASPSGSRDARSASDTDSFASASRDGEKETDSVRAGNEPVQAVAVDSALVQPGALALVPAETFPANKKDVDVDVNSATRPSSFAFLDALLSAPTLRLSGSTETNVELVSARVSEAYASAAEACFAVPPDAPDPDAGEVASLLAAKAADAFERAVDLDRVSDPVSPRADDDVADAHAAATRKRRACELATRALCRTAKDLRAKHAGVSGAGAKAKKRREHLLQAHLRFACASLAARADAPPSPSASAKLAKTVAKLVGAVTFLLTPVGVEGVRRFVDRELAPRYAGQETAKMLAAARAELGVGAADAADQAGGAPRGAGGGGAVFSPAAPVRPARGTQAEPAPDALALALAHPPGPGPHPRAAAEAPHVSGADAALLARGAARQLPGPNNPGPPGKAAGQERSGANNREGWHPVFRSRATRVHRQVTMPDPARRAAERQREAAREAERCAKERAAAAEALIERDGAVGRSRLRDGGKRKARVSTAQPSSDAMMPAPRRLAVEFGSGNDELPPPSSERRPRAADPAADPAKNPPSGTRRRGAAVPGGLETPARATTTTSAGGRSVGGRFGSTWLPHGGGLETPAGARTRVAATPVAARGAPATRRAATTVAATPANALPVKSAAVSVSETPRFASRRVAETPALHTTTSPHASKARRLKNGTVEEKADETDAAVEALAKTKPRLAAKRTLRAGEKKKSTGLASFGAMVREGREETEHILGGKRARR